MPSDGADDLRPAARATGTRFRCLIVVPFLNEGEHLPVFLSSIDSQTRRPERLILVDDGSTDDSRALAEAFAKSRPWVAVASRPRRTAGRDRLAGAPELAAFLWAVYDAGPGFDVVVKMDADLRLAPRLVETVLAELERDERLGIAGTYLANEDADGVVHLESQPATHVRGATRFYRRACFDDISPVPVMLGWDGADEVRARARGWRTRSFIVDGEQTIHLRPTGAHDGRLRAHARWGACAYAVGSHPLGVLAGAVIRARNRPWVLGGLAYAAGWAGAHVRPNPRAPDDIRAAKRIEQRRQAAAVLRRLVPR